jgi:hypothetical protein
MAKKSAKINEVMSGLLETNEEIRAVGQLTSGLSQFWALLFLGILSLFTTKYWYVAITNKQVLLVKLTNLSKPDLNQVYRIPFSDVQIMGNGLSVRPIDSACPKYFKLYFGAEKVTGLDKNEFIQALNSAR